jgi:hypothetical protein
MSGLPKLGHTLPSACAAAGQLTSHRADLSNLNVLLNPHPWSSGAYIEPFQDYVWYMMIWETAKGQLYL